MTIVDIIIAVNSLYFGSQYKYGESMVWRKALLYQFGTFMPFFYWDSDRTLAIIPGFFRSREGGKNVQKTYSDIFTLVDAAYNLWMNYVEIYKKDPNKDVLKLLKSIAEDPKFKKIYDEFVLYQNLEYRLKFKKFYHPLICPLRISLNKGGVPALMDRELQIKRTDFDFYTTYVPTTIVDPTDYPVEDLDFDLDGSYTDYNWELFFHSVYEVALKLNQDQRFEQAQSWLHYIFNPLAAGDDPAPQRYWVTKPLRERTTTQYIRQSIEYILRRLARDPSGDTVDDLKTSVMMWLANPFQPWVVAKTRTVEYQVAIVLAYIKNLCDWGDSSLPAIYP
jgi:hypothetical protein